MRWDFGNILMIAFRVGASKQFIQPLFRLMDLGAQGEK